MTSKSVLRTLLMTAFFAVIALFGVSVGEAYGQCDSKTDTQIVESIYAKIKANSKLAEQAAHINVTSTNRVVKLFGWGDSKADRDAIYDYAMTTSCVTMVNAKDLKESKPSEEDLRSMCSGGTKPCGDICIPENDTCNITGGGNTKQDD